MIRRAFCRSTPGNSELEPVSPGQVEGILTPILSFLLRSWVGCPQALQSRKPSPGERETRIWLVDGSTEIAFGAEVGILRILSEQQQLD